MSPNKMLFLALVVNLVLGDPSAPIDTNPTAPIQFLFSTSPGEPGFFDDIANQYPLLNRQVSLNIQFTNVANGALQLQNSQVDFFISSTPATASNYNSISDLKQLVFSANPVVFAYNLAAAPSAANVVPGTVVLIMNMEAFGRMILGKITHWNDPYLVAMNPGLTLPNSKVELFLRVARSAWTIAICQALLLESPSIQAALTPAQLASFQTGTNVQWPVPASINATLIPLSTNFYKEVELISQTPGSIGYMYKYDADNNGIQSADMINNASYIVRASARTVGYTLQERACIPVTQSSAAGINTGRPQGYGAWPITSINYLWYRQLTPRTTCKAFKEMLNFIQWMYVSNVASNIASNREITILSGQMLIDQGILNSLHSGEECDGKPVSPIALTDNSIGLVSSIMQQFINNQYSSYASNISISQSNSGAITTTTSAISLIIDRSDISSQAVVEDEGQFAIVFPIGMQQSLLMPRLQSDNYMLLPLAAVQVVAIHSLFPIGSPYQLVLDLITLSQIISGQITKWNDASIIALNPSLAFVTPPVLTNTNITVILATDPTKPDIERVIIQTIAQAIPEYFNHSCNYNQLCPMFSQLPFWPGVQIKETNNNIVDIATQFNPYSISLMIYSTQILSNQVVLSFQGQNVLPTTQSAQLAFTDTFQQLGPFSSTFNLAKTKTIGAYPLAALAATFLPTTYSSTLQTSDDNYSANSNIDANCGLDLQSLQFLQALHLQEELAGGDAAIANNIYNYGFTWPPLSSRSQTNVQLNTITCNGNTQLVTLPVKRPISSVVVTAGLVLAIIITTVSCLAIVFVYAYKLRTEVKAASPHFLIMMYLGTITMSWSGYFFIQSNPTDLTCESAFWLGNLGIYMTFAPIFGKQWRVYKIFMRSQMTVIKITDLGLFIRILAFWTFDLILLIVIRAVDPFSVQNIILQADPQNISVDYCAPQQVGLRLTYLIAALNGLFIISAAIMAFTTSQVQENFAEAWSNGMSIYNVLFVGFVAVLWGIVEQGDPTFILSLVAFVEFWVALCTLLLSFLPKAFRLWKTATGVIPDVLTESRADRSIEESSNNNSASNNRNPLKTLGDFVRTTIRLLDRSSLRVYIVLLEKELTLAKTTLATLNANESSLMPKEQAKKHSNFAIESPSVAKNYTVSAAFGASSAVKTTTANVNTTSPMHKFDFQSKRSVIPTTAPVTGGNTHVRTPTVVTSSVSPVPAVPSIPAPMFSRIPNIVPEVSVSVNAESVGL